MGVGGRLQHWGGGVGGDMVVTGRARLGRERKTLYRLDLTETDWCKLFPLGDPMVAEGIP